MITREQIPKVMGHAVHDAQGKKIGEAAHLYLDDATGEVEWVAVKTGFFGNNETFVPTRAARLVEDHLEVPYEKDQVKGAPNVDVDSGGHLSASEEQNLYRYYGMEARSGGSVGRAANGQGAGTGDAKAGAAAGTAGAAGVAAGTAAGRHARTADTGAPSTDKTAAARAGAPVASTGKDTPAVASGAPQRLAADGLDPESETMIRSEEEMHVRVERETIGQARLHKVVDVEEVEQTVPIRHEEVHLVREPIDPKTAAGRTGDISEAEQVVTLHEDKAIIETEVVPKERVRMRVDEHVEQKTVHGRVRKERIETDTSPATTEETSGYEGEQGRKDRRFGS
ncbi:DUF2382 domain-containing protein [Streptomyces sp. NPDC008079]|uniref:DUF2382 domain-containing protein n=1 Tax=Streptomyces sp. NPDC008079 TaxID=3364806 RepID=UPI0036E60334